MIRALRSLAPFALSLATPSIARADEISNEEDVCGGREVGAACTYDGQTGTCQDATCSGIDYSTGTPKPKERACRRCVAEAKAAAPPPAKTEAPPATPPSKTPPPASTPPTASSGGGACAIDGASVSFASVGLGLVLLVLARRRTRRR